MKEWQQNIIPQLWLSQMMGKLANAEMGALTRAVIKKFISHYNVNMAEAKISDYRAFKSFNDFFTRELKSDARVISENPKQLLCPADGCVSELGTLEKDRLLQAKGAYFNVHDLCGGDRTVSSCFENGAFLTAYLSPRDYHRFHMPLKGQLKKMIYVPGKLFSVNQSSVKAVPGLFARNERVVCIFETEIGNVALIAVGAMIVGSIAMKWHGIVAPQKNRSIQTWSYDNQNIVLQRGEEVGHFRLGSTVIVLCEKDKVKWDAMLKSDSHLKQGQVIAEI